VPKFRVLIFSPEFNVVRRDTFEAEDEFAAVEVAEFRLQEKNAEDPEARYDIREIE
jgi:hypothetical protein